MFLDRSWLQDFTFWKCHLPHFSENAKLTFFWQILISGLQIFKVPFYSSWTQKCKVSVLGHILTSGLQILENTTFHPTLPPMQSWHFWKDFGFRISHFQSATSPRTLPPLNAKLAFLDRSWLQDFWFSKCHFPQCPHILPLQKMQSWCFWKDQKFTSCLCKCSVKGAIELVNYDLWSTGYSAPLLFGPAVLDTQPWSHLSNWYQWQPLTCP